MNTAELTQNLTELYQSGRRYGFVQQSHRALSVLAEAPELAALALRALVELGYGGPARELIQLRHDLQRAAHDVDQLQAAVAELTNGRVPWNTCENVFRQNSDALLRQRPQLREVVEQLPQCLTNVHLYRSAQGHQHVSRRQPGQLREWLPNLSGDENEDDLQLPPRGQLHVTAIIGLRLGSLVRKVFENTHKLFLTYSHPLYLIEPNRVRFAAWMHCADHRELLEDERVHVFVGEEAVSQFRSLLDEEEYLPAPQFFIDQSETPAVADAVRQESEDVHANRNEKLIELTDTLERRYRNHDSAYWAERVRPPGRVLAVTSRYTTMLQYSTRDALAALHDMGYEPHMLIETKNHHQMPCTAICKAIEKLDPVMILYLDHLRYEHPHIPKNLPFLTWIQDPMPNLHRAEAGESIGDLDFVCGISRPRCTQEFGYPEDRFVSVDVPVCVKMFHDGDLSDESWHRYACDVSFVSNASMPLDRFCESTVGTYPASCRPMLDLIYQRVREMLERNEFPEDFAYGLTKTAAKDTQTSLGDEQLRHVAMHFAYRLLDWGRRQQTLQWVGNWASRTNRVFKLYGRGWENHPTLSPFAAGVIEHGEPLRQAYRASKLSLQLIPSGFRHQRSYEILAGGSLPLTRYCHSDFASLDINEYVRQREAGMNPNGEKLFPKLERIAFQSAQEFETIAERYLDNEADYTEVLTELRNVVLAHCTYDAVMKKVMAAFRARLVASASPDSARLPATAAT